MSLPGNTRWNAATGFGFFSEVMWRIFQAGKKSQPRTRFTLHEVTKKKKSDAWQIYDFISPSSELQDYFLGGAGDWNNANLLGETKIFPPGALAFTLLTSQAAEAKTNTLSVGFLQFCFYIGFYVKLLTAFYDQDAPFKYLHDTTFWCERQGPARHLHPS